MEKFYERYWDVRENELDDFPLKWSKLLPHIPREKGIVILDFGCGAGHLIEEMRRVNPEARFVGVDVSHEALARAKTRCPYAEFHHVLESEQISLPSASVDFIFSSEVIEHVYDTEWMAGEMARVLRPGGRLLLTTPYHGFWKNLAIVLLGFDRHFNPTGPHVRFFSKKSLATLLEKFGVKPVSCDYYGRVHPFSHSIVVLAEKRS